MPDPTGQRDVAPAEDSAVFITPASVTFLSAADDRRELRTVALERRRALSRLRRTDRRSWRDAP